MLTYSKEYKKFYYHGVPSTIDLIIEEMFTEFGFALTKSSVIGKFMTAYSLEDGDDNYTDMMLDKFIRPSYDKHLELYTERVESIDAVAKELG